MQKLSEKNSDLSNKKDEEPVFDVKEKDMPKFENKCKTLRGPFLIEELARLTPYMIGTRIKFHVFNMPNLPVEEISIMGYITSITVTNKIVYLNVDDGTGDVKVIVKLDNYQKQLDKREMIDHKYMNYIENINNKEFWPSNIEKLFPKTFPRVRSKLKYPKGVPSGFVKYIEKLWYEETNGGLKGKQFELFDYVQINGYCNLDFEKERKSQFRPDHIFQYEDILDCSLSIFAFSFSIISEEEYHSKLLSWIENDIKNRYV